MSSGRIAGRVVWAGLVVACAAGAFGDEPPSQSAEPVIRTGVRGATRDKPHSKLWHAHGYWWAWLPTPVGSAVWQRAKSGWRCVLDIPGAPDTGPRHADVWVDSEGVRAVLVEPDALSLVGLRYDEARGSYAMTISQRCELESVATPAEQTETATVARDSTGAWWAAYDRGVHIYVRRFRDDDRSWSEPVRLGGPTKPDDICAIAALSDSIGVIWSNQRDDAVYFAAHRNGDAHDRWQSIETVERGNRTADDHLNAAIDDGTLYVASKNSVDQIGMPQLVLRVRRPDGRWENHPYAVTTDAQSPSRPIVVLGGRPRRLVLVHAVYPTPALRQPSHLAALTCDASRLNLSAPDRAVLRSTTALNSPSGCKQALPPGFPWIALASNLAGDVFEIDLDALAVD